MFFSQKNPFKDPVGISQPMTATSMTKVFVINDFRLAVTLNLDLSSENLKRIATLITKKWTNIYIEDTAQFWQ